MSKRPVHKHLVHILILSLVITLIGGGAALLYQGRQGPTPGFASNGNVVGPPSLPASYVDAIFQRVGSPMVGTGRVVEQAARAQNIDDAFALAVWWTETNDGAAGVGLHDRNPGSVRGSIGYPSAYDGYTIYPSYSAAVTYWFSMIKRVYINRGLTTVYAIAHPYVGTSTSNLWAGKVITLMQRYRAGAPKVAPTPKATRTVPPDLVRQAKALWKQDQGQSYPQATIQNAQADAQQSNSAFAGGLNTNTKLLFALIALLLALGLGLWARNKIRRSTISAQIANMVNDNRQQTAAAFSSFTGILRNTENLTWPSSPTGALAAPINFTQPNYMSEALLPPGAFMATQTQEQAYVQQIPFPMQHFSEQSSSFHAPARGYSQTTPPMGAGLPGTPPSGLLHRTRLLPSRPASDQFPPFADDFITAKQPQLVGAGCFPSFAAEPTTNEPRQLVSAGSGGRSHGLLSRYREMQAQGGQ